MHEYLNFLYAMANFCNEFMKLVIEMDFTDEKGKEITSKALDTTYCWSPKYQEHWVIIRDIVDICDMFGIRLLEKRKQFLMERVMLLNSPESISYKLLFEGHLHYIRDIFKECEKEIREKLQLLDEEETDRLNEALNCYIHGCNYSAVAMSVSAIEFRLVNLMQSVNPNPKLEKYTLGELINEYLQNKKEYKNIIPKKHEPLLNLCNTYRIFSVHPKLEKIKRPIATSIINLTFEFLLDKKMMNKIETK